MIAEVYDELPDSKPADCENSPHCDAAGKQILHLLTWHVQQVIAEPTVSRPWWASDAEGGE